MADKTRIEWADATINPAYGCTKISPACANCYAERMASRMEHSPSFCRLLGRTTENGRWTGHINCFPERMEQALKWKKPRRIFVGSMTDLFHRGVPDEFLDEVFGYTALARNHTFMVLTKRPERMCEYFSNKFRGAWIEGNAQKIYHELTGEDPSMWLAVHTPLPNVWIGVTVENQAMADARIPFLLQTPAAKRFVSIEPMLGPVDLREFLGGDDGGFVCPKCEVWEPTERYCATCGTDIWGVERYIKSSLDWVICGGETGPGARPMHPDWVRSMRDQCAAAGVPFFFKQWGELVWLPVPAEIPHGKAAFCHVRRAFIGRDDALGSTYNPDGLYASRSRRAGRLLDGVEHNGMPEVHHA